MMENTELDWADIIDTLEQQKCLLFLGSGAFKVNGFDNMELALSDHLDATNPQHPLIRLYNTDGFFLFRKGRFKRRIINQMKDFYNQPFPGLEDQLAKLVRIPFSMIFTLTPDNLLSRAFDNSGFDYQSDFYFRNRKAPDFFEKPTKDKPLIYNLLGNIEEPESIILTHSDFFDYLNSVFKGNSMNSELRSELENAEQYIFLGLPYEKWYFQLLLRVLSMHSDKLRDVERLAFKEFENPNLRELYTGEFNLKFIPTDISSFISQLYEKCETAEILKEKMPEPTAVEIFEEDVLVDEIRHNIEKNKIAEAIEKLKLLYKKGDRNSVQNRNILTNLTNRFHILSQRYQRGTIYQQDFMVENSQIVEQLVGLISKPY
ncbi:MAG: SIR2 family protein [Bacteroidota bacterium]